jgi:serine/threonine protein kinase
MDSSPILIPESEIQYTGVVLGSGCFGQVLEASWNYKSVAVKKIRTTKDPPMWNTADFKSCCDSLKNEIELLRRTKHSNIVQLMGIVDDFSMVVELMHCSLDTLLYCRADRAEPVLPIEQQVSILIDICNALDYLHSRQQPILHLDIKPANILLDGEGPNARAKLADLGISRVIESLKEEGIDTYCTVFPGRKGTPGYSAPEVDNPTEKRSKKGCRTDMFSLGVVMCELSSGKKPNPSGKMQEMDGGLFLFVPEEERRANDIASMTNDGLRRIARRLLVHKKNKRWRCAQVLKELELLVCTGSITNPTQCSATQCAVHATPPIPSLIRTITETEQLHCPSRRHATICSCRIVPNHDLHSDASLALDLDPEPDPDPRFVLLFLLLLVLEPGRATRASGRRELAWFDTKHARVVHAATTARIRPAIHSTRDRDIHQRICAARNQTADRSWQILLRLFRRGAGDIAIDHSKRSAVRISSTATEYREPSQTIRLASETFAKFGQSRATRYLHAVILTYQTTLHNHL